MRRYAGPSALSLPLLLVVLLLLLVVAPTTRAMFAEDAGKLDFLIATAGHGPVTYAATAVDDVIVTAGAATCHVAGRSSATGELLWRRHAAVQSNSEEAVSCPVTVVANGTTVVTADGTTVRGWSVQDGRLLWDRQVTAAAAPIAQLWPVGASQQVAVRDAKNAVRVLDAATGEPVDEASKRDAERPKEKDEKYEHVLCKDASAYVRVQDDGLVVHSAGVRIGEIFGLSVDQVWLISCKYNAISVLATSKRGTTTKVSFSEDGAEIEWAAEEGLSQVSSALMLDASHEHFKSEQEKDVLQLSSRLASQWKEITTLWAPSESKSRDHLFGFVKIAVLLSTSANRIFGVETSGAKRTSIRYQVDLPVDALWHRMIHGSVNSEKAVHGINGGAHTREVLVLSSKGTEVEWICMDGTSGETYDQGLIPLASSIVQVIPLAGIAGKGKCRQNAVLLLEDQSLVAVAGNEDSLLNVMNMYAHSLDKKTSTLNSFSIASSPGGVAAHLVGSTAFPGEEIIAVAYPPREEVIQSPCNVLGDDSLLLKYLNPHLSVILTMGASSGTGEAEEFPLKPAAKKGGQKRKPVGVTQPGEATKTEDKANFFVNVVDTVSGRVLYRASHANALLSPHPSVLVSENWVFYTFTNGKTRKAELGVLSLYEGMIDKNGLTAFTSPEQLTSFSSLDARETKPVVLAKTFTIPMPATALGMTSTRSGISGRQLLLAGLDGQINAIGRKMLEPRRPLGQVKDSEKKEGLVQYHELIQTVSYMALSYNQTVESVHSIITAPTDAESQTLILAFGGPDIFFTRTSPSRGFDLLPDNFNRVLLSIVVAALVVALVALRQILSKKVVKQGWV